MRAHSSLRLGTLRGTTPELLASPWYCTWAFVGFGKRGSPTRRPLLPLNAGTAEPVRVSPPEAVAYPLELLQTLPETPERRQREVDMHIALGASLLATKGYAAPEVGEIYMSARHLCEHLDEPLQLFPVLRGLWNYYLVRAEYQTAQPLGEQLLSLAQQAQDTVMLLAAHRALGATLFNLGAVAAAHTH